MSRTWKPSAASTSAVGQGELVGVVPGVAADHHVGPAQAPVLEDLGQRPRGAHDDGQVHRIGPTPYRSAQPGGAEGQRIAESAVELIGAARGQFGRGLRVGVVGDPIGGGGRDGSHDPSVPAVASA